MMKFRFIPFLVITILLLPLIPDAKEWRGIVPLHSTRDDVDRLIGSKKLRCGGHSCLYDLGEETVLVSYSGEQTCKGDDASTGWKVPRETVIEINVHFKTERALSDLGFDLTRFERVENKEQPGWVYYRNREEGIEIEGGAKIATGINYFQRAEDNHLRCPKN
jgi:hypothetical protein